MTKSRRSSLQLSLRLLLLPGKGKFIQGHLQARDERELLEKFIREYIGSQTMPQVLFTWHGGETLMRPLSFYKRVMGTATEYAGGRTIDNCIQTNGTLLTDEWCEFFKNEQLAGRRVHRRTTGVSR